MKPDLSDVLAEVNRLRAERGMEPLDAMPKGKRVEVCECPVARAVEGIATHAWVLPCTTWQEDDYLPYEGRIDTPATVKEFMRAFDRGEYPELVA